MSRFIFILFLLSLIHAQAAEYREFYNGARSLGMGGADIAVVNDETALLINPAGLGKVRDFYGTLLDPEIDVTENYWSLNSAKAISNPVSIKSLAETLDLRREKYYHFRQQVFPSIVVRNFGIGAYMKYSLDAEMNAAGDSMRVDYFQDAAFVLGYNFRFFDGRIKLGFTEKILARVEVADDLDPTQSMSLKNIAGEGVGLGTDVGLIMTAPWTFLPTLAVVARDVGGNNFGSSSGLLLKTSTGNKPTALEQDMDVALAIFPIHANKIRSSWTIEYKGVTASADDDDKMKYYHFGAELNLADLFFIRAGMNGRYYTVGLEFASEHTQIQFAYYGEEIGTADSPKEDRRFVSKFAFRF